jgi:hypothetical protein
MIKGVRSLEEIKKLADVVQEVMLQKFNAPPRDRYLPIPFPPPPVPKFPVQIPTKSAFLGIDTKS